MATRSRCRPGWRAGSRALLTDPQTSGGLLVACAPERSAEILRQIVDAGYPAARIIGHVEAGAPGIRVEM